MIYATHGVIAHADYKRFAHRNLLDREAFKRHMQSAHYVTLKDALQGLGDALTIDDGTRAAEDAVLIARECRQPVTLFINGLHTDTQLSYWFCRLSSALDETTASHASFDGVDFDLRSGKDRFRQAVKDSLKRVGAEEDRQQRITDVARSLGIVWKTLPWHLNVIPENTVQALVDAGVDIQNHGWTHAHSESLTRDEHEVEIFKGRAYIREHGWSDGETYAVPYGYDLPRWETPQGYGVWLRLMEGLGDDAGRKVFDRRTLRVGS